MPQSLRLFVAFGVLASLPVGAAWARRPAPPKTEYRWERMTVVQVLPSQVFAKLGLTHTTRYGFTRDGHTKKTPDPTFPAGLTDVVPYDVSHLLLVRGTPQALAQFRRRVLASENEIRASGRWHVTVDLLPPPGGGADGLPAQQDVAPDVPFTVSVGDPAATRQYRLRIHTNPDATLTVLCQVGLLPTPVGGSAAVLAPAQVWGPAVMGLVSDQGVVTLDDPVAARQISLRRMKLPEEGNAQDFQLRVTVTLLALPAPSGQLAPMPPALGAAAASPPEETNAPPP